ncbi:hypothetical protein SAMN04488057_10585 [Cyclobacterium lianum]|uniref:Uncharacterized protein n=1 Tax=Cyclobacterium lianum TaxID=388280 RepID=A0A1M7N693_9BACT|nr:hypothetical protein [Cyclobacterium lianum]SHM99009.1 hypothetical protein SAMN04488057_10585 [Cyclobacterium lianum]
MADSGQNESRLPKSQFEKLLPEGSDNSPPNLLQGFAAVFNGLGIGLFLGLLLGLSVSPVVSGVIGTITSLLAILIGLNEKFLDPVKSLRIGAFGLFSVVGIVLGLYIRANDPFAPGLADKMEEYLSIGYTEEEAKAFVTGFIRADSSSLALRQANVLYSSEVDLGACDFLVYANAETIPVELFNTFETAGGIWKELTSTFKEELPESTAASALLGLRDIFCKTAPETIEVSEDLKKLRSESSLEQIEDIFSQDTPWNQVQAEFRTRFDTTERKQVYESLIKVLNNV